LRGAAKILSSSQIWSDVHVLRRPCISCDQGPAASLGAAAPPPSDRTGAAPTEAPDLHFEIEADLQHLKVWRNGDFISRSKPRTVGSPSRCSCIRLCQSNNCSEMRIKRQHHKTPPFVDRPLFQKTKITQLRRPLLRRPRFSPRSCSASSVSAFGSPLRRSRLRTVYAAHCGGVVPRNHVSSRTRAEQCSILIICLTEPLHVNFGNCRVELFTFRYPA
jgi:hypothetical protein